MLNSFFNEKKVLINGGSRGIGRDIAVQLANHGACVAFSYVKNREAAEETTRLIKEAGSREPLAVQTDLSDGNKAKALIDKVSSHFDGLDIMVNCHGLLLFKSLDQLTTADWQRTLDVNLNSVFHTSLYAGALMRQRGWGRIINLSSMAAKTGGHAEVLAYATAKGGVISLTRSLAIALASDGVTVNCIAPALIETDMLDALPSEKKQALADTVPVRRIGRPQDVTHAVLFLAHENAGFITGETININGGRLMD